MQKYSSNITTSSGSAVRNAAVYVFAEDGSIASIFSDRLGQLPLANPVTTASDGTYSFYAANGRYSLQCTVEGVKYLASDVVLLDDPADVTPGAYAYPLATQAEAEDSANASPRSFTPQRIWQAIAKWWAGITVPVTQGGTGAVNAQGARIALGVDYGTTAGSVAAGNDQRVNDGETAFTWGNHALAGYATHAEVAPKLENITGLVLPGTNIAISGSGTNAAPYVIDSGGASGALWGAIGGTLSSQSDLSAALAAKADSAALGTAATKDAQTSPTDTVPGLLMGVGAFGLGGVYNVVDNLDCNLIDPALQFTGLAGANSLNGPPGLLYYYVFQLRYGGTENRTQIAIPYSEPGSIVRPLYMRGNYNGVWSAWKHMWDSDNLNPAGFATAAQGAKADAAIPSSGIGSAVQAQNARLQSLADATDGTTGQVIGRAASGSLQFQNAGAGAVLSVNNLSDIGNAVLAAGNLNLIKRDTVAALVADAILAYAPGAGKTAVAAGAIVGGGPYRYAVAASAAVDHDLTTAGGVKLYVLAADGAVSVAQYGATGTGTETALIQAALNHPDAVTILADDRQYTCDEVVVPAGRTFRCNLKMATPATASVERNLVRVNPGCTLIGTLVGTNQTATEVVERGVFPAADGCNDVTLDVDVSLTTVGVQAFFADLNNPPLRWKGRIIAHDIACFDGGSNGYGLNGTLCQSRLEVFCKNVPRHSVYLAGGASDNDIILHDYGARGVPVNISSYSTEPASENNHIVAYITGHQANYPASLSSAGGLIAGNCDGNYVELHISNSQNLDYAAYIRGALTGAMPSRNRIDVTYVGMVKQSSVIEVSSGFNNEVALRGRVGSTVAGANLVTVDTRDGIVPSGVETAATIREIDVDCFANIANAVAVLANYAATDLGRGAIKARGLTGDAVKVGDVSFWPSVLGWVYENYFHATGTIAAGVSGDITVNFGRSYPIRPIIEYALIAPSVVGTNLPTHAIPIIGTASCTVRVKNNDTSTVTFIVDGTVHGF